MRTTRFGAFAASAALASATILGGASLAQAQSPSSEPEATVVETVTVSPPVDKATALTATSYDNCTVSFTLTSEWGDEGNWRADYRVDGEEAVMANGLRNDGDGVNYRPALGSHQGIEDAIDGRYDFDTGETTIDLTEDRVVPSFDDPSNEVVTLDGVAPNADGIHEVAVGLYQGPVTTDYDTMRTVTVTGCPTTADEDEDEGFIGSVVGSVDVFGSLEGMS